MAGAQDYASMPIGPYNGSNESTPPTSNTKLPGNLKQLVLLVKPCFWPPHRFLLLTASRQAASQQEAWLRPGNTCCSILCAPGPLG